jgi:hypothetical protein
VSSAPTAPVAAGSLVLGYVVARETGVRPLGGVVLAAAGAWCTRAWVRGTGPGTAAALLAVYSAGFAGSHPLAKRIGAWPAVFTGAAVSGAASWVLADRRTSSPSSSPDRGSSQDPSSWSHRVGTRG